LQVEFRPATGVAFTDKQHFGAGYTYLVIIF